MKRADIILGASLVALLALVLYFEMNFVLPEPVTVVEVQQLAPAPAEARPR